MTFFLSHASSAVGRLLFQGNKGVRFRAVKVFVKKYDPERSAGVEIFCKTRRA
jgi:hypothetical protein